MKRSLFSAISTTMVIIFLSLRVSMGKNPMGIAPSVNAGYFIYSLEELKTMPVLHLSICGHVFDVSAGERFYGADGMYKFFGRKDATRAFATGDFKEDQQIDNVSDITDDQCVEAQVWLDFFNDHAKYEYVGVMDGYFFDAEGKETAGGLDFKKCAAKGVIAENIRKQAEALAEELANQPIVADVKAEVKRPILDGHSAPNSGNTWLNYLNSFFLKNEGPNKLKDSREEVNKHVEMGNQPLEDELNQIIANVVENNFSECDRVYREDNMMHVKCEESYTPRKTYFTAGKSVNVDGTPGDINIITCVCVEVKVAQSRSDLLLYHDDCNPTSTECIFDNNENDIHH